MAGKPDAILDLIDTEMHGTSGRAKTKKAATKTINIVKPPCNASTSVSSNGESLHSDTQKNASDIESLRSTVETMASSLRLFMESVTHLDDADADSISHDDVGDKVAVDNAPAADAGDTVLSELEKYFDTTEAVAGAVDAKLAKMVNNLLTTKLPDDKLKEKQTLYSRPDNCDKMVPTRVNPEIWDKISPASRSRDLRLQNMQASIMKGIVPIVQSIDTLVEAARSREPLTTDKMADMTRALVDSVALLGSANHALNQKRRDLMKPDLNTDFTELCSGKHEPATLLFGDDLSARIKQINETNKVTQKLQSRPRPNQVHPYKSTASQPSGNRWKRSFKQAFLEKRPPFKQSAPPSSNRQGPKFGRRPNPNNRYHNPNNQY